MANTLTIDQISTVLASIYNQATGQAVLAPTNTKDFVTVADTTLRTGYNNVIPGISQVLSKTIFSERLYTGAFKGLRKDSDAWGNHVRKLTPIDTGFEDSEAFNLTDGVSVDMYKVNKPKVIQTNFYGQTTFDKHMSITEDQLKTAFTGPEQLGSFLSMIMTNAQSEMNQARESLARMTLVNFMGAKIGQDAGNVIHVLTQYNTETGQSYDIEDLMNDTVFVSFAKWFYGYVKTVALRMRNRSALYHVNLETAPGAGGKKILRHTPAKNLKMYWLADTLIQFNSRVLPMVFNDEYLKAADVEEVTFWQHEGNDLASNSSINVKYSFTTPSTGVAGAVDTALSQSHVLGIMMDEEAVGITEVEQRSYTTPFNAAGHYYNQFWHWRSQYWNDLTENAVVFVLD